MARLRSDCALFVALSFVEVLRQPGQTDTNGADQKHNHTYKNQHIQSFPQTVSWRRSVTRLGIVARKLVLLAFPDRRNGSITRLLLTLG